ncbi:hypothetical protein GCM10022259_43020 [Aquimarina mytili]
MKDLLVLITYLNEYVHSVIPSGIKNKLTRYPSFSLNKINKIDANIRNTENGISNTINMDFIFQKGFFID